MAGITNTPPARRAKAVPAATAKPAVDAAADRAAIERAADAAIVVPGAAAGSAPLVEPERVAAADAAVLPEVTLAAEPGAPRPIVTASPPLTGEPDAVDVAQAEATARAPESTEGVEPDRDAPHPVVAGQPMLTIERSAVEHRLDRVAGRPDAAYLQPDLAPPEPIVSGRVTVIEVIGPHAGRRRAGFTFGPEPRRFLGSQLTDDQIDALRGDPMLTVGISEIDADAAQAALG